MAALEVSVPVFKLERIRDALTSAHYQNIAFDMVEAYRNLDNSGKQGPLTRVLEANISELNGVIADAQEEEEPDGEKSVS